VTLAYPTLYDQGDLGDPRDGDLSLRGAPGRPRWWREVVLIAVFYGVYTAIRDVRGTRPVSVDRAFSNARKVIGFERHLGIFHEVAIQHLVLHSRPVVEALDVWYGTTHFVVTGAVLLVLFLRFPERYCRWRNTLAVLTAIALVGFASYPLMPPRLLPASYGFTDTLEVVGGLWNFDSGPMTHLSNLYAAMPSLHFAWALWCAVALVPVLRRWWTRFAVAAYPAVTLLCVIVTANHYFIDTAAGALTVALGYAAARGMPRAGRALALLGAAVVPQRKVAWTGGRVATDGGHRRRERGKASLSDWHRGAGHAHGVAAGADASYLAGALALIVAFMVGEVVVAVMAGSLALFADAGHMLTDAAALGAALWAARLAGRPPTEAMTFGFHRAEVLSAATNGVTLLAAALVVTVEAVQRLLHPSGVDGGPVIAVAAAGIVVNVVATAILARADRSRFSVGGAFSHLLTDLWAFVGTLVAGVVIVLTGFYQADSIASVFVVALMGRAAWRLLRASGRVLLEGAPEGVDLEELRAHLLDVDAVTAVHDLHAWVVTSDLPAVSAHVVVSDECFANGRIPLILDQLQACLAGHFDVEHSTFQVEPAGHLDHEAAQHR